MFSKKQQANRKPKTKRKGLRSVSAKKRKVMADRSRVLKQLIDERGNICELRFSPDCTLRPQGLHERLKQSASPWKVGDYEKGRVVFLACNVCNAAIENEPIRARALGFVESRYDSRD